MKVRCMESPMSSVSFNGDMSCLAVASATGFGIFSTSPFSRLVWQASEVWSAPRPACISAHVCRVPARPLH